MERKMEDGRKVGAFILRNWLWRFNSHRDTELP
jgi:hypothetical protein